jgi:aspartyl-tRNA(Asn)/glutamyl-tRNA(Gln) amidotransferase subunit A
VNDMGPPSDLLAASATELVALYRAGRASPVEVAEAVLERIAELDGAIGAFCLVDGEQALAEASAAERRWQQGRPIGLLDGIPVAVKDLFLTNGWPTLRGSWLVDESGPWDEDAPAVAALRRHGAVLPGKTTTPERRHRQPPPRRHPQPVEPHPHERRLERRERGRACVRDGPAGPWH